jgi:hypothetical protein
VGVETRTPNHLNRAGRGSILWIDGIIMDIFRVKQYLDGCVAHEG